MRGWTECQRSDSMSCGSGLWGQGPCLHRNPGTHRQHGGGLLEDGLAGEELDHRDDHQPGGEKRGQCVTMMLLLLDKYTRSNVVLFALEMCGILARGHCDP